MARKNMDLIYRKKYPSLDSFVQFMSLFKLIAELMVRQTRRQKVKLVSLNMSAVCASQLHQFDYHDICFQSN